VAFQKTAVTSGAEAVNLPAQQELGDVVERPRGGWRPHRRWRRRAAPRGAPPLLDSMVVSACTDNEKKASRKRRRAYHRLRTGLTFHHGKRLRFLTLTLIEGSKNDIHACFRVFKERIRRLTPNKIRKQDIEGYFTPARMRQFFGKKEGWDKSIKFEYFSVIVYGKRPHMHILYFGDWLPHAWLKKVWKEITGDSEIVDIRTTKDGVDNEKSLTGYVLSQYALLQEGDIRFQMSQGWTWRGMVRDWKLAVRKFTRVVKGKYIVEFRDLLFYWADFVRSKKTKQMSLIEVKTDSKTRKKNLYE